MKWLSERSRWGLLSGLRETCSALRWPSSPCDVPVALFLCLRTALWTRKTSEPSSVQPTMMFSTRDVIMNGFHSTTTLPPTARSGVRHREKTLSWTGLGALLTPWNVYQWHLPGKPHLLPGPLSPAGAATTVSKDNLSLLYFSSCRWNIAFEDFNVKHIFRSAIHL